MFWKIFIGFVGLLLVMFLVIGLIIGMNLRGGAGKEAQVKEIDRLAEQSTADLTDAKKDLEKAGDEGLDDDYMGAVESYTERTLRKADVGTFLEDYEYTVVNGDVSLADGIYVFYDPDKDEEGKVKVRIGDYIQSGGEFPVKAYYMPIEDSAIAAFSVIANATGGNEIWDKPTEHPMGLFIRNGLVVKVYEEVRDFDELPTY